MPGFEMVRWLSLAVCLLAATSSCSPTGTVKSDATPDEQQIEDVSSAPLNPDALKQEDLKVTITRLPRIASEGDCAPQYKNGMLGSCIAGKQCRGFGVRDESGKALCSCYGTIGGCLEGQRCDDEKLACVPEDEPGEDPIPVD